jgi:glycosyltransferase involved in cell wall biosynthesis
VGKLNERKGVHRLFDVYQTLQAGVKEPVGLILIGEGPLMPEIARVKESRNLHHVYLEGWLANEATAKYYAIASVFVLLSSVDHNPLVLFEALAAGTPIVCSKGACNAVDFIESGINGYIVDPADSQQVLDRIQDVLAWNDDRLLACKAFSTNMVGKANYSSAAAAFISACRYSLTGVREPLQNSNTRTAAVQRFSA